MADVVEDVAVAAEAAAVVVVVLVAPEARSDGALPSTLRARLK